MDGQSVPASAGWQLSSVDLAIVNATTDYSEVRPGQRAMSSIAKARTAPDFHGVIFILRIERVTRCLLSSTERSTVPLLQTDIKTSSPDVRRSVFPDFRYHRDHATGLYASHAQYISVMVK